MRLQSKLPDIGTTIFAVMSAMSNKHNAINLSQGFPNFNIDPKLIALVEKYMEAGNNQYAPMQGMLTLREQLVKKYKNLYQANYCSEKEITISAGATEALYAAITSVVSNGDEVIIFEPAYDSYSPAVQLNGGVPVFIELKYPDYKIDWNEVQSKISSKTRMIILNSPHNPTGSVLRQHDLDALKTVVKNTDILILSDEVYEHLIYDDLKHLSMASDPELASRSFVIGSFGKTFHATGWKTGYCLAPETLTIEFQKIHQFLTYAVNTPVQLAYAEYMSDEKTYLSLANFYQSKRDLFLDSIKTSRFRPVSCLGTYFQMLDYSEITNLTDVQFAEKLIIDHGVATIPPSVFYNLKTDHKVLRFCFAKTDETLVDAAEKLNSI